MKPPVEHVRVSAKGKDMLIKIKRNTGLEHWNEICRIALFQSLANPVKPTMVDKSNDSSIDMDWKTFAGAVTDQLTAVFYLTAYKHDIDFTKRDIVSEYFRNHLERGIIALQNVKSLQDILQNINLNSRSNSNFIS